MAYGNQTIAFKPKRLSTARSSSPYGGADGGSSLAAALAALNPSGVSNLGATSLGGFNPGFMFGAGSPAPTAQAAGATQGYDFSQDPIFQQATAIVARTEEEAKAQAIAKKTQLAIQYGDASGLGLGSTTEATAKNNPFSVLKAEERNYNQGVTKLEDQLNKGNLYYSGWRGTQLGNASTAYQQNRYNDQSRFQAGVQDIDTSLQAALMQAEWQRLMLAQQMYQGGLGDPGAYGLSGGNGMAAGGWGAASLPGYSGAAPVVGGNYQAAVNSYFKPPPKKSAPLPPPKPIGYRGGSSAGTTTWMPNK